MGRNANAPRPPTLPIPRIDSPAVIAHRGFAADHPENTLTAFRAAATTANAIELDVRQCATGELVIIHDPDIARVTTTRGRVRDTPAAVLRTTNVLDSGEPVPLLTDALDAIPPDVHIVFDVKVHGIEPLVVETVETTPHPVIVSSFHPDVIERVTDLDPTIPTAFIANQSPLNHFLDRLFPRSSPLTIPEDPTLLIHAALDLGCTAIHPHVHLCLGSPLIRHAQDAGLTVNAWTVTTPQEYDALAGLGVDGVIADTANLPVPDD